MRIAYFLGSFPTISETFILRQVVGMIRRGHDVYIEAERPSENLRGLHGDFETYQVGSRVDYLPIVPRSKPARLLSATARIITQARKYPSGLLESLNVFKYGKNALNLNVFNKMFPGGRKHQKFDVIHCHFGPSGNRAVVRRKVGLLQGSIITTFHGYDVNALPKVMSADYYKGLSVEGDLFTVSSEFMRRPVESLGMPADRIIKLPMGVNISKYEFKERRLSGDTPFHILSIGRLVEVKGFEYLLRALALLAGEPTQIVCTIGGDGPLRKELEDLTGRLGIAHMVKFAGAISEEQGNDLYRQAHCFILASVVTESGSVETQGVVLAEAQACGLPIIATDVGGIPESLKDKESGLLVPQRDPEALAAAIRWLMQNKEAWPQMGRSGRAYVEQNFNLEVLNDRLVDIYSSVIENNRTLPVRSNHRFRQANPLVKS